MGNWTRRTWMAGSAGMALAASLPRRDLLRKGFPADWLAAHLIKRENWHPFPRAAERRGWEELPADARKAVTAAGEACLGTDWPALPATLFLEFARNGNRSHYERVRDARRNKLRDLVMAECVEFRGRFLDDVANGIWTTCEETYWGLPAHVGVQKAGVGLPDAAEPTVDLFAAETSALLAWTLYLLGPSLDGVSRRLQERIFFETDRRILTPNLEREDFGWMGFSGNPVNNWNPWINSNWLAAALLLERDEERRRRTVGKILRSLDNFLNSYHDDGGCDEGPGYWFRAGGSLFDCLELLYSATGGALDLYGNPLVKEIGRYIYRAHIHDDYFINFADASARLKMEGDLVNRYGRRIGDEKMAAFGAYGAEGQDVAKAGSIGRQLPALMNLEALRKAPRSQALVRDVWLAGIQVMAARRKDGSAEGLYLAAQGGHNAESHNHNDVGNFIVYADGEPVVIDVGVETYTAKTFSSRRYEIWTMQSAYHNLPAIGGVMQSAGREYAARDVAYRADDDMAEFSLNLEGAYPEAAGLRSWKRVLRLDRKNNEVEVRDRYELRKQVSPVALTLMTPRAVQVMGPGQLRLGNVKVGYEGVSFAVKTEEIAIRDARLRGAWGERLYRVLLTAENPAMSGGWTLRFAQ
ncbi:MAG: heparinase II/III-family protein [Bryobacterales bacterium]|nr:heparinase II/III-family protein [Bryobacterales bacterium]